MSQRNRSRTPHSQQQPSPQPEHLEEMSEQLDEHGERVRTAELPELPNVTRELDTAKGRILCLEQRVQELHALSQAEQATIYLLEAIVRMLEGIATHAQALIRAVAPCLAQLGCPARDEAGIESE